MAAETQTDRLADEHFAERVAALAGPIIAQHVSACPVNDRLERLETAMLGELKSMSQRLLDNTTAVVGLSASVAGHARRLEILEENQTRILDAQARAEERNGANHALIERIERGINRTRDLTDRTISNRWGRIAIVGGWVLSVAAIIVAIRSIG